MEIECDLASIRDEDLLRKMWQQSEDFGRKKEIRSHLYKLRESRLREFYSTGGPGGEIMNPATDLHFGKSPLTPSHGDSLADQSFQSLKSKEIRDSLSPTHDIKFRNSGGVAGGVLVPDTTGWNVQSSSEVSPDGRAFRTESLAKTDGVEKIPGGHAEFAGRNEQKSSASHQGDDKNYVKKAAESSKTHLQEKVVIGDENSGRTEMKSSSVTSSSKVVSSSSQQVFSSDDPGFDMEPRRLTNQDQHYQKVLQDANNSSTLHSERQQFSRNERNERQETSSSVQEESRKYVDMDKASPEYQQHVQYLMSQPGAIVSNTVEYPKPGVKMITTVKKLPDGTTVKTKRYETEASAAAADSLSISQTMKQQQQQRMSSNTTTSQKMTEKRIQDSEDVFTRLARTRDSNVPASPRNTPESPSNEDVYTRLQQSRDVNQQKFSDSIDQRSTQILRDNNQYPGSRNAPIRRPSDQVENVETISKTNRTVKKDLNQSVRSEKITSSDFIQNERDRYVIDHDSQTRRGPDSYPEALAPITPNRHGRPQPDDYPSNGYNGTEVVKQSSLSKSSAKFSESRRYSTETVESYQHSENENQDYTTRGYPSNRRPIDEPQSQSPSRGRPAPDFSTHGFPSVRSDKPTHQSPSDKLRAPDEYNTTERVHTIHTDRPKPGDVSHSDSTTTTRSNYSTNETRRHVTSTNEDFSTHGFPSVRAGTPTRDSPRRPLGSDPTPGDSPRRPSGQEPPSHQARKPPTDGYSTHGFPSVKSGSPTEDSPRRPSGSELTNQGRRPTTEDFSTHGFPSVKPGRSTPTQSAPQYESAPRVEREDTVSVTSDRSNSVIYEKKIDAAHQAFARSLRCASPVEPIRRDSTSDRHTPRSSIGSIRNSYSPSKRDGRSPSHDSVTNSESSRISSATVTKSQRPTEVRRVSGPKSPIGKSAPSHVSNETIDLSLTRKITAKPSPDKTTGRPTSIKEEPVMVQPILRKKIFGATENFLASEGVIEKPIIKSQPYYQLGLSDATLPSSYSKARQQLGTTPNTSRRPHNTGEEVDTLIETATKHITTHPSSVTPRSAKNKESKPIQPETLYSKKPITKPEGYVTLNQATEITEKQNQTTNKHVSYPHYIPSAPKADRSPSNRPTTNNLSSPAPITTTTSTTPHNAPKSTKDKVKPSSTTSPTSKPLSSPSKVDNSTPSRFTKTVKVENAINRDTTTKTRRQPELEPESELDTELLAEPEDLDEGYVPDRKGKRKPSSQRPTSDDEGFEPDSPRAGSPTSDFEYRRPEQVETYDEEDSFRKKTNRTDKKVVTNEFLNTERYVTKTVKTPEIDETKRPKDRGVEKPEGPKRPEQSGRKPLHSVDQPTEDHEPKRPLRRPKEEEDTDETSSPKDRKPSHLVNEPKKNKGPNNELTHPDENNRRPYYEKEPIHTDDKPSRPTETSRPRGTKPPLERSETFEERCRQILGMDSDTVVDRTKKTEEFIDTERTTVDSKRKSTDRSPSPKKKQPSDTVSIEDCDDDDTGTPRSYPVGTTTTTTTVKTTRDHPRDKSPNKKEPVSRPRDHPRDQSPVGKLPKGAKPNEYDETTTIVTTTNITDDRSTSPNRKSPKVSKPSEEDDTRPRGHSPSKRPERFDETTTIKKTSKLIDESDERSKPGSRPRGHSPQKTQPGEKSPDFYRSPSPQKKQPSDTVSIEDCDDDSDTPRKIRTSKTKTTTTFKPSRDHPRDKSPIEKGPTQKSPKEEFSPTENDNIRPRGRSPTERPGKVDDTTRISKTTKIIDEIDKRSTRSKPDSRPTDQSPQKTRPRDKSPTEDSDTDNRLPSSTRPKDRSPSEKRTFTTTRETTFDMDTSIRGKSPSKQPIHETSPTVDSPRDKPSSKKPTRGTSPTNDYPSDRSPTRKPVRETSPTYESPSKRSPTRKPVGGTSTDETIISSTTTTHSNVTDGNIEDRYPSYTPKNYPRDRSPSDKQKPKAPTTEEDVEIETSKKAKKISTKEIHDDVFEVNRPRQRQPDTRDGAFISHPRDQSPSEPETLPGTEKIPRDRSPQKPKIKETEEVISKRTTKKTSDTTIENEFTDKSPTSSPRAYPRDRSPNKKPTTDETEEYRGTTKSSRDILVDREPTYRTPQNYPRDRSPVHDLTRPTTKGITETQIVDKKTVINEFLDTERRVDRPQRLTESKPIDRSPERLTSTHPREYPDKKSPMPKTKGPTTAEINVSTITKSTKSTRDTTTQDEVEEVFPSSRPRDRSPSEKPIRSPRIVTTETTTEYGIRSRPRSQSPSEKPKKPLDFEEIDETYVQETKKITEKSKITTDLDADIEKPSRRPRPTSSENKPREKSPQKPKSSDRSPSPRSKYPKDQGPRPVESRPQSRSPVGKQPKTTGSPRQSSPSEKSRIYQSTDEKTNLVKKSNTTKVTTTSEDVEDVDFETRPRGRSPTEKPRGSRPITSNQSPRDQLRGPSPTKKPEVREPTERDNEETVVKRTNKTTRNETTLEDKTERSPRDRPRQKSPSSKPTGIKPREETFEDCLPKSPRESSPSEKSRPKDYHRERSPSDKPRKPILNEEFTIQTTLKKTTLGNRSPKHPREPSPSEKPRSGAYPHDRAPSDKPRKPGMIDETIVKSTTTESTIIKDRLSKIPRGTSPTEKPGSRDYPRERSPTDTSEKPRRTSPSEKPSPREYPRDRSPTDKSRMPRLYDETVVGKTTSETTTIKEHLSKSPRGTSPTDKPGSRDYPRDRSPTDTSEKPRRTSPSEKPGPREYPRDRSPTDTSTKPRRTSPSDKPGPREYPSDRSPTDKSRMPRLYDETVIGKTTSKTTTIKEHLSKSPRGTSPTEKPGSRDYPRERSPTDTSEKPRRTSPSEKPGPREYPRDRSPTDTSTKPRHTSPSEKPGPREYPRDRSPTDNSRMPRLYDETVVGKTTSETTIIKEHLSKSPRGTSPTEKPGSRDYPRERSPSDTSEKPRRTSPSEKPGPREYPRDMSPTDTSTKPRRTSPSEKPGPREYPRDRSPIDNSKMPRLYDETVVGKTTSETTIIKEHLSKSPRGTSPTEKPGSRDYPRDRSPSDTSEKPRRTSPSEKPGPREYPRDRSPTDTSEKPRRTSPSEKPGTSEYPRDRSPTDKSRMPRLYDETVVGKTASETTIIKEHLSKSPRGTSPTEKPGSRDYPRERSPTNTSEKPRRTSPSEKPGPREYPRDMSPTDTSTKPRRTSPSEKPGPREYPRDRSPIDNSKMPRLYDETVVGKTTSETTIIKEHLSKSPRGTSPTEKPGSRDYPRDRSPSDTSEKPRRTSPSEKPGPREYPRDRSPTDTSEKPRRTSPSEKPGPREYPRDRSPTDKSRMPRLYDETVVGKTTSETTIIKEHLSKSPRGTSPTEKPGSRDYPRERSPTDTSEKPRRTSPSEKPGPREYPRDRSPTDKSRMPRLYDETVVGKTTFETITTKKHFSKSPRGTSPTDKPGSRDYPRDRSPTDTSGKPRRTSPSEKPSPREYPRDRSPTDKSRMPRLYDETVVGKTTSETTIIKEHLSKSPRGTSPTDKPGSRDYPRDRSPSDTSEKPRRTSPSEKPGPREYPRDRSPTDTSTKPRRTSPSEKPGPREYPRDRSPTDKSRMPRLYDETVVGKTNSETTTLKEHLVKSPRGTSPTDKPGSRDYPRDRSPTDTSEKPRRTSPSEKPSPREYPRDRSPTDTSTKPRRTSPSEKPGPRNYPRDKSPTDTSTKPRRTSPSEKPSSKVYPRDRSPTDKFGKPRPSDDKYRPRGSSPTEKPGSRQPRPVGESIVKRTVNTTTVDDRITKTPRGSSPIKTSPRERSPTQKPTTVYDRPPKDSPRRTSPSEKPTRRQPTVSEVEKTVQKTTSKFSKERATSEKIIVRDHPRRKSPSEKPSRHPTSDEETDDEVTETVIAVYTIDGEKVKNHPRDVSPSGKPKQPSEYYTKRPETNGDSDHPREIYPTEKPRRHQPTDDETEETFTLKTSKLTNERKTFEEIDIEDEVPENRSPKDTYPGEKPKSTRDQPRETSPSTKPRGRQPTDESIDITVVEKTSRRLKGETTLEDIEYQFSGDRPRDRSPSKKPTGEDIDETVVVKSYKKTPFDDDKSPLESPRTTEETVLYTTRTTLKTDDHPRVGSPSHKPGTKTYPRDRSPTDKSPSDKPRQPRPSRIEDATNRTTTVRKTVQETDFEKRYPKGRPGDQSPIEKPSTLRRPSKLSSTTTTTTTRNRSTLDEQDINRTQRLRTQPSTRDKVPTKTTLISSPRTQPTTERRIPAELPSPVRKPKSTLGTTTKTTTVTRLTGPSRPKPTSETPKKSSKLPLDSRPSARPTNRKPSPSISPDSSPSRPGSDVEIDSPYRSPNMSPSRKSPSPTRSVKLEDITTTFSTTKKATVSIDKSKPKVTHVTTAKFQVTPPTSPTKVISSPEMKFSPSSKKPSSKVPTSKPNGTKFVTDTTTTKKVTSRTYKEGLIPTDSERDSEVPTDAEEVDSILPQKPSTRKLPVTERKESAPVHRVTKLNKDVQMSRSTSENIIKTPISKHPNKHEPLEPQREDPRPTVGDRSSPKTERRPSKHLSTKTINLTTFDKVINSEDMENVIIDIQHAKSSREPSPNKIVPTPVSIDVYTGKPRYPDVVQEPEDEPKKKPNVKNIPIFEEETNDFVGCQITEVSEETRENTLKARTTKFIEKESSPKRQTPKIVTGDNVDSECLLSVHDKVSKFISTAEEVSKPKTSAPFRRDVPEKDMPEDDECLLTVDEKVSKFLKTADSVTKEVVTSKPRRMERPSIEDLDEDLKTDECVLSVSEKVNKFTTKAEKLGPSAPQRSPELVARIERQISRQSDVDSESPEGEDSPASVRKFKPSSPLTERSEKKYTERQIDILSRPSVWEKKPKHDVKLDDIIGLKPEEESRRENLPKTYPHDGKPKPVKTTDSVSKRKELFENKVSTHKTATTTKQSSPEKLPSRPVKSSSDRHPSDDSDSRYPSEFLPQYVDGYVHQEPDDDVHEDVYGSSRTRHIYEASNRETIERSTERSPTRKSSQPDNRPTTQTPTKSRRQPDDNTPSRRYSEDHSPRYPTRDQSSTDRYTETSKTSDNTTRRRSSTQEYPERRTPYNGSHSPLRKQPVEEPEDYTFSSRRDKTTTHHTTAPRSPKDSLLNQTSFLDDEEQDHSPARSTSTVSSHKQVTTHRSTSKRLTEDITSRRPRRPSGNEPTTPTSANRTPRGRAVPETVAARRNIFEKSPGDISPMPTNRRPSYMEPTKSSLEHRKDSLEITKTNYSRKSSIDEEPYEPSPRTSVKFGVGLKHKEEPKSKRKLSSSDIPNIEDVFELELLEEMLNIVTLYEQRRRIRAQIRVVKKLLETKTKEEVSRMTKITTIRKTSSPSVRESPTPKRETPVRSERYQLTDDDIDSESIVESRHVEEHEEIIRERSISPKTKTSKIVTKVTEVRKIGEPSTPNKRTPLKKDEPKDSKPIWATKNILKKPSDNEKVTRALSAKKTTSTSSSSMSRTQQTQRQRVSTDDDCVTSSYGIGPTDEDGRPLFGIRALKKKTTTNNTVQPSETTKVTGTVITEKYYSENGAEPVGERKVTVYSTNPEDLVDMETQYDRRDSETVKREKLSKDGVTTVTKVQKIGKYKPGEIPSLTDEAEFTKATSKMVRRGSVKEMSEKFIRKESSSSVTEKSSGYPKAGLILRTRTNSGATADAADQYEVRAKSTEYDYDSEDDVEIRSSRKHSKVVAESEDETEIRRKINTRSFLNSAGSKVTGIDDVLDRMRNADNVVVDGDTLEDREARSLLNKFLGASVLMSGMESMVPQMELRKTTTGADNKQEVKTTRVTKTIKSGTTGESSSSPVARETCDFEEIWDEEILKQLLEKSTSYEERRSIRARLRQLMADREACAELKAGAKAELNETKVKTSTIVADDESSGSEYEEIIEEYTASEDDDEDEETTTATTVIAEKQNKNEVKGEKSTKQITEEIQKTTITKKEEPKSVETKKTIVVETTTVIEEDASSASGVKDKKLNAKEEETNINNDDDGDSDSVSDSKGESLLIPLLQGLLHKNMPQARSSSGSSSKTATNSATTSNQNSNNLKSSLKANNTHFSSTSKSNNNNSLGDSGLSSEVSKNNSLGQKQNGSSLRVAAPQQIEDSGTESGEDLRLIAAGIRDSMQIEGIENHSDMSLIKEVTNALNKLESSLKEGKDLALDSSKKSTLLALVERLQTGLTAPDKLSSAVGEQDFPDETSSPEADNHRSNRQRFAKRKNRNNRHTVGVSKEELADARRYIEEMVMIENLSNCTTPECNSATTPPELFTIQKQHSTGAILSSHEPQEQSAGLFRPNQFVPNNLKHSTEAGSAHPDVQLRQKKGTPGPGQRQSTGDMNSMKVPNSDPNNGKRPLSDSFDSYTAQNNRVTFSDPKPQNDNSVEEKNEYNRSHHSDDKPNNLGRLSPDSSRLNRFNNKKQLMKRANTIDIPKTHRYNPEFDTDSDFEERSALHTKGLRGTLQVTVKRKPRQVVPNFEPKTENDHKFLAFIQKQSTTTGLGWNSSKSVSNWTNKFGNIKNVFESGANVSSSNRPKTSGPPAASSAKSFWKKSEEQNPQKTSTNVLTSALKAKERNEKRGDVVVPKPIHLNKFSHNPQSAFRPVDTSPETIQMQFKPIPMEKPSNVVVSSRSPTKTYNPVRRQALESPHYSQSSPTKSWIKKNTATNSPVTLPWTVKPPENNVLKIAATKFESHSPVQRHQSFKQQEKRPSLPNTSYPYQYQDYGHSQQSYVSNSQPTSYAEYPQQPRIFRESSLTNPQAEPLILTSNAPAYSPHSLQPFDYYTDDMNQNVHQTDMTDDDIDDMESMTEYRVEAKVMGKPLSQQAVTVGKRTSHMSDDEVFGKNSRAAKNLLSVMKNIGNGKPDRTSRKPDKKQATACISPNGSAYQAPIVEPLFPEVTKFEANRDPEYIGQKNKQQAMGYHQNPVYVPLEDYQQKEPPVAPPRGRKLSQETKKGSAYIPKERPNIYQPPRRDAPSSLPIQAGPTSPPRYIYSSPIKSPDSSSVTSQILTDGMYMQNVPAFRKPHSEPNTPSDYSASNEAYFNQYGQMQKSYPTPQPRVILPQIPLETSYTKVYDQPRDVASLYQPPVEHPNVSAYVQSSPKVQQNSQPSIYIPPEYQQKPEPSHQYYQSPKVQHSPLPQEYAPQQAYPPRAEVSPEYYHPPKVQQSPQPSSFVAQQQAYQPRVEAPQEYYQAPRTQQVAQLHGVTQESVHLPRAPVTYYQSPQIQSSPQPQIFAPQYADTPQAPYDKSPKVPQSPRSDVPSSYYQSPKTQQSPQQPTSSTEIPFQYPQSPKLPQVKPSTPQQVLKYPIMHPQSQHSTSQTYQSSKTQQNSQPMSPLYQPKAPVIQAKPQVTPKNESVTQSSKSQYSSSSYHQQQIQSIVTPTRSVEQQAPNAAVLCKQASLEGRKRVQSQSQKYEQVEEIRRKSLGNVLEITRDEREAQEQKAAAIKQDMYSVQQDVYSQQKSIQKKTEVHQQETKVAYKSSAPDDTPDIVKSSLKKDDIPILKKFGPPQRHCYMPNAYQNPLMKSETTVMNKTTKTVSRKFSDPSVSRGPLIVEIPSTPQPDSQDEIPRNIVFNKISAFTSMSRKQAESSTEYTSQQSRPNKLSKCDSWHQICQLQTVSKPPSPRFNTNGNAALRRSKSGHTLALPKLYEATYDRAQISEKQRTVAAYFTGQKSPNSLSRNSSQTNLAEESNYVSVKKSSINRIKTSEKASIGRQDPSSGLSRSHTMPQIANVNLLDESNVEDAFEQLMNGLSTTTTEKTETKNEDGGVVTTTTKVTTRTITGAPKPVSPFAKFQQLDKQNSLQSPKSPLTPTTPGGSSSTPIFRFTDPALNARAATFKEQLLQWCQSKTQEYENVQITNFSASWTDGLAFCALIHHFLPDAFDYSKLNAKQRRYNFELAFRVADEKAGIAPLLDVEDMVVMKRPDWKCVFTYVQSIYRRFRNCQ